MILAAVCLSKGKLEDKYKGMYNYIAVLALGLAMVKSNEQGTW